MNRPRAIRAGVIGTVAMTLLFLVEPLLGLGKLAEGSILSTLMSVTVAKLPVGMAGGWVIHFLVGIALAALYAGYLMQRLPGSPVVRGALFGVMVFVVAQLVFMPLVGAGVFAGGDVERIVGSLLGHLVYGGVVGWIYGASALTGGEGTPATA